MKRITLAAIVVAALAVAGQAGAATYKVLVGEQSRAPAGVPKQATLDQFLPAKLTIDAGDSVVFSSATFHTVTYAPKPVAFFVPDPAKGTYADVLDAAGQAFAFSGLPKFIYNPLAFAPYGPRTISGATPASSGVLSPSGPKAKAATATYAFPAPGVYRLLCNVHPGMQATIVVKPAGTPVPLTPPQVQAQALAGVAAGWAKAKALAAATVPASTVYMGVGSSTALLGYLPQVLKVKAGTTVTFVNRSPSEVHDVVFGPQKYVAALSKKIDLLPQGPNSPNQVAPVLLYGSEPKGQSSYDGSNHGNGFFATSVTAGSPRVPLPHSSRVTFTKPGTYKYFCWIHGPDMSGTIVVTP